MGETALHVGTGLVGFGAGLGTFLEGAIRKAGQEIPTRKYIEDMMEGIGPASDPHYWENLKKQVAAVSSERTYTPRTPQGKALSEIVTSPFQLLHYMSEGASQAPLARMLFTEDQRHAVAYAHEILLGGILGEIGMGVIGRVRAKKFQQEFSTAVKETETAPVAGLLPKNAESLLATAEEIITAAEKHPEI